MCTTKTLMAAAIAAGLLVGVQSARAHCDGLDGPVVAAAQNAWQSGDANRAPIWVRLQDADEIKKTCQDTLAMRKLGSQAQAFADHYLFETLVRIHRAGENARHTGLKPAGRDPGPAIPAADKAIETGAERDLAQLPTEEVRRGLRKHLNEVLEKKNFAPDASMSRPM
ncbi:DUF6448 family protein [Bradyrhizobium centrolobii]|nr:DUF6448 family protein [Bradyrhizobium centrolobii]